MEDENQQRRERSQTGEEEDMHVADSGSSEWIHTGVSEGGVHARSAKLKSKELSWEMQGNMF